MTDTATTRKRLRKQSLGSNVNSWGDTKVNEVFDAIDQSIDGYLAIALTGDVTLTTTNYSTADQAKRRIHKFTGTLSAAAAVTYPSVEGWYFCINAAGAAVTVKTSAGTGIAIPNGRAALVYCDASDFYSMAPNHQATAVTLTNAGDLPTYSQIQVLIANATTITSPGQIKNSASDTTAGYLSTKLLVTSATGELAIATENAAANEDTRLTFIRDDGQQALYTSIMGL